MIRKHFNVMLILFLAFFGCTKTADSPQCIMYVQVHNSPYMETIDGEEKGVYPVSVVLGNSSQAKLEANRILFDAVAASSKFDCEAVK